MKKILTVVSLLFCLITVAQNDKKLDRIKALKVAYISNQLNLTAAEAEKFWPIYNVFDEKQFELRMQKRMLNMQSNNAQSASKSDKELTKLLEDLNKIDDEIIANRRILNKNLQGIISPQKIFTLQKTEDEFKRELLRKIKQKRKNRD